MVCSRKTEDRDFWNAAMLLQNGRAGGACNSRKYQAKASRNAGWMKKMKKSEVERRRGRGSLKRRAERRRLAAMVLSMGKGGDVFDVDHDDGYLTASDGDDDVWPWGLSPWVGGPRDCESVDAKTQTSWSEDEGEVQEGCKKESELPRLIAESREELSVLEEMVEARVQSEVQHMTGQIAAVQVREVGIQTAKGKLTSND